ncbi:MAG TPA: PepSY-associated TM helix domain-containing protein [Saprospiraceae bacterium]|nr:PepSY-associated TM helix domain-containing protein [Saprospiraceae bacterium]
MKYYIRKIHQWLGLISGLLVFIIAITGCLYAFQEEIQNWTQPHRFVEKENGEFLLPSALSTIATKQLPGKHLHSIKYNKNGQAAEAIFYHYEPTYYYIMYMNPYSGKVLHTQNMEEGFFPFILKGHFYLWFPPEIGQPIVAISTLIFLVMILSGLFLWWPKNKKTTKSRTWFRWKSTTKWKRKNFDIHAILGFYSFFIAIIFAVTGLVWGFQWFAYGFYKSMGGEKSLVYEEPLSQKTTPIDGNGLDMLYDKLMAETPNLEDIEVHPPETETSPIAVNTNVDAGTYWKIDYRYFDQYSLQELEVGHIYNRFDQSTFADKLMRMNYDIHTGAVFGLAGKIFMFLFSLLIASLPITGFLFWYGRRKGNRKSEGEKLKEISAKISGNSLPQISR